MLNEDVIKLVLEIFEDSEFYDLLKRLYRKMFDMVLMEFKNIDEIYLKFEM